MKEIVEKIKVNQGIPHMVFYLLIPLETVGVFVFVIFAATHWAAFVGQSAALFAWTAWFTGLVLYTLLAWLAVRVLRSFLETVVAFGKGITDIHGRMIENRAVSARVELLETRDHYVVYRVSGKVIVQPVTAPRMAIAGPDVQGALLAGDNLPTSVRYEDIRDQIPHGHVLVGIGKNGVETKDKAVGACVWIVGLSGTGKTSTTVLRVEERHADGHKFMGIDPHFYKPDSLTNAIRAYSDSFIMPMARNTNEAMAVLQRFYNEFDGRKAGRIPQPWQKITLLVDEVTSLMDVECSDDPKQAKEVAAKLKSIARICGQEARNFQMGGIFISQQATGVAWLRKMAQMVIVHQLLMESEKKLACDYDAAAMEDMKRWPIGRTYVYGLGFMDGPRTVQQPFFKAPDGDSEWEDSEPDTVESTIEEPDELPMDEDLREAIEAWHEGIRGPRALEREFGWTYHKAQKICRELTDRELIG